MTYPAKVFCWCGDTHYVDEVCYHGKQNPSHILSDVISLLEKALEDETRQDANLKVQEAITKLISLKGA